MLDRPGSAVADSASRPVVAGTSLRNRKVLVVELGSRQTSFVPPDEPPEQISYELEEAFTLLGALEDARDALIDSGHLAVVVAIETEVRTLSRKLGFDDLAGGTDGF